MIFMDLDKILGICPKSSIWFLQGFWQNSWDLSKIIGLEKDFPLKNDDFGGSKQHSRDLSKTIDFHEKCYPTKIDDFDRFGQNSWDLVQIINLQKDFPLKFNDFDGFGQNSRDLSQIINF